MLGFQNERRLGFNSLTTMNSHDWEEPNPAPEQKEVPVGGVKSNPALPQEHQDKDVL